MTSFFFSNLHFCSNMSNNGTSDVVMGGIYMKFSMEALTSEVNYTNPINL